MTLTCYLIVLMEEILRHWGWKKKLANKLPINWCRISSINSFCASVGLGVSFHNPCTTRFHPIIIFSPTNKIHYPTVLLVQSHTNSIFRKYPPPLLPFFFKVLGSANLSGVQFFFYVFFRIQPVMAYKIIFK